MGEENAELALFRELGNFEVVRIDQDLWCLWNRVLTGPGAYWSALCGLAGYSILEHPSKPREHIINFDSIEPLLFTF